MNFVVVDIVLLVLFIIFMSFFLYRNKKNLKREGLLYLYRTSWGMKLIDKVGKKYQKTLKFLSYVSIVMGYALMAGILWLFGKMIYLYVAYPAIVKAIKIPPITPLLPYVDRLAPDLGLPTLHFIYFILILAVIAIPHEFAHGIFMRRYDIKIKSTGFGFFPFFLPIFLAAFVEQDEKSMTHSGIFKQLSVLSAGTFANVLTALVFGGIMVAFFILSFAPAGVHFNTYAYSGINISSIDSLNGVGLDNPDYERILELSRDEGYNEFGVDGSERMFLAKKEFLISQKSNYELGYLILYYDSPAIRAGMEGAIVQFNGVNIESWEALGNEVQKYSPGEEVEIITSENEYRVVLGENPEDSERGWIGVGYRDQSRGGIVGWMTSFKDDQIYYEEKYEGAEFIYNFLWWLVLISFSVALVNMLPMGIFDGGRFFYLTILAITKKPKVAEKWFKGVTTFLLLLLLLIMVFWAIGVF